MITFFAAQTPTIVNTIQGAKRRVFDIENQIPFVETKIVVDIPSTSQVLGLIPINPTPEQSAQILSFIEEYKALKETCTKVENQIQTLIDQIDKILTQLSRIDRIFSSLDGFISILTEFIPLLRVLIGAAQVGLVAQVFPIASGVVTVRLGDAIRFATSKLKEIDALTKVIEPIATFVTKEITEIRNTLLPVRRKLQQILIEIRARKLFIDDVIIRNLKNLELSTAQNPPDEGGLTGPQGTGISQSTEEIVNLLSSQFNPEDILDNLENSNKEKFIEYLVENGYTGYQIVKK